MKRILILAPHLLLPPRNGADLLVERNATYLATNGVCVTVLAASERLTFSEEKLVDREMLSMTMRSRTWAGIRTIMFRSNFFKEKFLTRQWTAEARRELASHQYAAIVGSYVMSASLIEENEQRPVAIWTHNDEYKWFETLAKASRNPLQKLVARTSSNWTRKFLLRNQSRFRFLHVTEADMIGFHEVTPGMESMVQPVGADVPHDNPAAIVPGTPITLIFVGSLGVTMNFDALEYFSHRFWPSLLNSDTECNMLVVGSNPSDRVQALCNANSWTLHSNVSDSALDRLYRTATCAVLPFPYATGAKLKLLGALAYGLPVFATTALSAQSEMMRAPCTMSDSPTAWVEAMDRLSADGLSVEARKALVDRAAPYSWKNVARLVYQNIHHPSANDHVKDIRND